MGASERIAKVLVDAITVAVEDEGQEGDDPAMTAPQPAQSSNPT